MKNSKKSTLFLLILIAACSKSSTGPEDIPLDGRGGGIIAFSRSSSAANHNLFGVNADGSGLRSLTNFTEGAFAADWSPDGTKILFYSHVNNDTWNISTMNADGTNRQIIVNRDGYWCHQPSWSPDGTRIVYGAENNYVKEIWIINSDGSNPVKLGSASGICPSWSPDGLKIAFQSSWDETSEIFTINVDGTNLKQLTNNNSSDRWPEWSPDGSKIVFNSKRDGNNEIYVMSTDGTNQQRLTNTVNADEEPKWSPDGSKIVFCYWTNNNDGYDIIIMNADGSNRQNLTNGAPYDLQPAWK